MPYSISYVVYIHQFYIEELIEAYSNAAGSSLIHVHNNHNCHDDVPPHTTGLRCPAK